MHSTTLQHPATSNIVADREPNDLERRVTQLADQCVACGMCLPVCPTYVDTRDEAESARGRISLLRGVAQGRLQPTAQLFGHLDRCLQCQACEAVCPAGVRYGELMDRGQAMIRKLPGPHRGTGLASLLAWLMRGRWRLYALGWFLFLYRASGLQWLARRGGVLRALGLEQADRLGEVSAPPWRWRRVYRPYGAERGRVGLFTGCVANLADRHSLADAIEMLRRLGYRVEIPRTQGCCGAMDLHAGRTAAHRAARRRNLAAFAAAGTDTVVYIASGCGAVLRKYPDGESVRFVDINRFVADTLAASPQVCASESAAVYLHIPCSMKNATREQEAPKRFLALLGTAFVSEPASAACCGAAGTYSVRHPALARQLGEQVLMRAHANGCDTVATCNVGCALHLQALAELNHWNLKIVHPISFAASQANARQAHEG